MNIECKIIHGAMSRQCLFCRYICDNGYQTACMDDVINDENLLMHGAMLWNLN